MLHKLSVSNILILVSAIFTLIAYINQWFYAYWMNTVFLNTGQYHVYAMQFFSSQFLHGWILHLAMNAVFIFIFWNAVENILGANKYALFFILSSLFTGLAITLFWSGNTVWISGFAMAVMAYYTLYLKSRNHPDYKWWVTALVINIWIWLSPWISLLGHLFWAIAWGMYYYALKILKK
jgi:membrane associated rhomboid family serine protease